MFQLDTYFQISTDVYHPTLTCQGLAELPHYIDLTDVFGTKLS